MKHQIIATVKAITVIFILIGSLSSVAYCNEENGHEHDKHDSGGLEVGVSIGYAYLEEENEDGMNLHLHAMKGLSGNGIQKYLSIGFGLETIFTDEEHYGAMISLGIHPWRNLVLSVSPGWEWAKHDGEWESGYATHLEATYLFEGSGFHYGPVFGYSKTQDDQQYTIGIHFGLPL